MIKVIILDLGKVIIDFDYQRSFQYLLKSFPIQLPQIRAVMADHALLAAVETGRLSSAAFHERVSEKLSIHCSLEEFKKIWGAMFIPEPLVSESFIAALGASYPLMLLSNTSELHFDFVMENYPILNHFNERVLSYQVGALKPDRQIYEAALKKARVPAEAVFFADDRPENIETAKELGIQAVQFESEEQLIFAMKHHGVRY
jgi:putative hydrolase of the HAD superfamily